MNWQEEMWRLQKNIQKDISKGPMLSIERNQTRNRRRRCCLTICRTRPAKVRVAKTEWEKIKEIISI